MRMGTTPDMVRLTVGLIRRADAGLARSAARNAAHSVEADRARRLDDARTMRDLQNIRAVPPRTPRTGAARG
jgi:hypothetical protein